MKQGVSSTVPCLVSSSLKNETRKSEDSLDLVATSLKNETMCVGA